MKTNITDIGTVMDKIKKLKASSYNYKSNSVKETTVGFLAQEVLPIFPELVTYSEAYDIYGINYGGFSVIAIKATQEQQKVIERQEQKINKLEARLEEIEALLSNGISNK